MAVNVLTTIFFYSYIFPSLAGRYKTEEYESIEVRCNVFDTFQYTRILLHLYNYIFDLYSTHYTVGGPR